MNEENDDELLTKLLRKKKRLLKAMINLNMKEKHMETRIINADEESKTII